jgi:hypothetical protein
LFKCVETLERLIAEQRLAVFIQDSDLAATYEKTPFAPVAVVQPTLNRGQIRVARRADYE